MFFDPPDALLGVRAFRSAIQTGGIELDLRTRLLYDAAGKQFYVNGEYIDAAGFAAADIALWQKLADERVLLLPRLTSATNNAIERLHAAYCNGYLHLNEKTL